MGEGGWSIFISGRGGQDMMEPASRLGLRSNCDKAWFGWPCGGTIEQMRMGFAGLSNLDERKALAEKIQRRAARLSWRL